MSRRHRCRQCGEPLSPVRLAALEGAAGPVEVRLQGYPVRSCAAGHRHRARSEPAELVLVGIIDALSPPWRRGRRRRRRCTCGGDLAGLPTAAEHFHLVVDVPEGPVTVDLTGPGVTCATCGRGFLAPSPTVIDDAVPNALIATFEAAGIDG